MAYYYENNSLRQTRFGLMVTRSRASKGFLLPPASTTNISSERRQKWLDSASSGFVAKGQSNKKIYRMILELLWPEGHGIPGPHVPESEVRAVIDRARQLEGKPIYRDPFRRLRELQGEEGYTCIVKEGTKYQLQSLETSAKRIPREKPAPSLWKRVQENFNYKCSHCGEQVPNVKLSPDHRVPRARSGGNEEDNWQPLCEQCNILKSSSCQGCTLNCYVCSWAFPEDYKSIVVDDNNKAQIKRIAEKKGLHQSDLVNEILRTYFSRL